MCVTHMHDILQKAAGSDSSDCFPDDVANFGDLYEQDEFRMYAMKVLPCSKRIAHNWQTCVFAHFGEKARRRDLRTHQYSSQLCPDVKREGGCPRGDGCPLSHNIFESWLHPELYRTQMCTSGPNCTRTVCFFAHTPEQLRVPPKSVKQQQSAMAAKSDTINTAAATDAKQQLQNAKLRANLAAAAAAAAVQGGAGSPVTMPGLKQQWGSNTLIAQPSNVPLLMQQQQQQLVSYSSGIPHTYSGISLDGISRTLQQQQQQQLLLPVVSSNSMACSSPASTMDCNSSSCLASQAMATLDCLNLSPLSSPMSSSGLIAPAGLTCITNGVTNINNYANDNFAAALQQLLVAENTQAAPSAAAAAATPAGLLLGAAGSSLGLAADVRLLQSATATSATAAATGTAATLLQQQQDQIQQQRLMLLRQEQQLQQQQALLQQLQFLNLGQQPVAIFN